MSNVENYLQIKKELDEKQVTLVAVSKTKPAEEILKLYEAGQKIFGENKVQELLSKVENLPVDIQWHLIGHLQTNKVKFIAPFVSLIHSVDSLKLLSEINKQAEKNKRTIDCLLQIFIASEETKFGLNEEECFEILQSNEFSSMKNISVCGLMGMASNIENENQIREEFRSLKKLFEKIKTDETILSDKYKFNILSMGMSSDYSIAVAEDSNMVRIGSLLFGNRY